MLLIKVMTVHKVEKNNNNRSSVASINDHGETIQKVTLPKHSQKLVIFTIKLGTTGLTCDHFSYFMKWHTQNFVPTFPNEHLRIYKSIMHRQVFITYYKRCFRCFVLVAYVHGPLFLYLHIHCTEGQFS